VGNHSGTYWGRVQKHHRTGLPGGGTHAGLVCVTGIRGGLVKGFLGLGWGQWVGGGVGWGGFGG